MIRAVLLVALTVSPVLSCIGGSSSGGCCRPSAGNCGPSVPPCSSSQQSYAAPVAQGYALPPAPAFNAFPNAFQAQAPSQFAGAGGAYAAPLAVSAPQGYAGAAPVYGQQQQQQGYQQAPAAPAYGGVQQQQYQQAPVGAAPVYAAAGAQQTTFQQATVAGPVQTVETVEAVESVVAEEPVAQESASANQAAYIGAAAPEAVQAETNDLAQSISDVQSLPLAEEAGPTSAGAQYDHAAENVEEIVPAEGHDEAAEIGDQVAAAAEAAQPVAAYPAASL